MVLGIAVTARPADAREIFPAFYYGRANPGDEISALIDGTICATTTAGADYGWYLRVPWRGCEGKAVPRATVTFLVNGYTSIHTETWRPGALPADAANGIAPGRYVAASAGNSHICALTADGEIACWGENLFGQSDAPPGRYTALSSGGDLNCALNTDSEVVCWGYESHVSYDAVRGGHEDGYVAVAAGGYGACALSGAGAITCVVSTSDGTPYSPPGRYVALSVGGHRVCGITEAADVACWNLDGSRWDGPPGHHTALDGGQNHACAVKVSGEIACWGADWGSIGGSLAGSYKAVSAGYQHSCALAEDGEATCWGRNTSGKPIPSRAATST